MAELVGWLVPMLVLGGSVGLLYYSFSDNEPELKQLTYEKGQLTARVAESTLRYTKGELEKSLKRSGNAQEAAKRMKEIQGLQMAESKRLLAMALNPSSTDEQRRAALQQLHDHLHHPPAHKGRIKRVKTKKGKNPWAREKAVA